MHNHKSRVGATSVFAATWGLYTRHGPHKAHMPATGIVLFSQPTTGIESGLGAIKNFTRGAGRGDSDLGGPQ